jgi:hypothetical protein
MWRKNVPSPGLEEPARVAIRPWRPPTVIPRWRVLGEVRDDKTFGEAAAEDTGNQ